MCFDDPIRESEVSGYDSLFYINWNIPGLISRWYYNRREEEIDVAMNSSVFSLNLNLSSEYVNGPNQENESLSVIKQNPQMASSSNVNLQLK